MPNQDTKYIVVIGILLLSLLFMFHIETSKDRILPEIDFEKIPYTIGAWKGEDLEVSQRVIEILETKDVIMRRYADDSGDSVILAIVYSGSKRESIHPPEICYLGEGVVLLAKSQENISVRDKYPLKINTLIMKKGEMTTKVWYWFLAGTQFVTNYYVQQLYFLIDAVKGGSLQGALIRVSIAGNSAKLEEKARGFIKDIYPFLKDIFRGNIDNG